MEGWLLSSMSMQISGFQSPYLTLLVIEIPDFSWNDLTIKEDMFRAQLAKPELELLASGIVSRQEIKLAT